MTLELNKLTSDLEKMGAALAQRNHTRGEVLARAQAVLHRRDINYERVTEQVEKVLGENWGWRGAIPTREAPHTRYPLDFPHPARATIVASDGSQVEPDRHGIALYYLINVGVISLDHGSGQAPLTVTQPQLYYDDDDLYSNEAGLIQSYTVALNRDVAEMEILATWVERAHFDPVIALADGSLIIYRLRDVRDTQQQRRLTEAYRQQLDRIAAAGAVLGAFISRPRHNDVVELLHLINNMSAANLQQVLELNPWRSLTDRELFADLTPGERSPMFVSSAPTNTEKEIGRHRIHFFYMNVGDAYAPAIARIEAPEWVATRAESVDLLRAVILRQASISGAYPYVLARAHELAVVDSQARRSLEEMVASTLWRSGMRPEPSPKARQKLLLGTGKRQHRL